MRSRYSAFVMKDADYLVSTWHPTCHAATFRPDIEAGFNRTQWLGLTVFEHASGKTTQKVTSVLLPVSMRMAKREQLLNVPDS
jgi:SEC-C motif-containing protein